MSTTGPTIAELGEHEVLRRLRPFCAAVVGDDGAVQSLPAGEHWVVTTDVLVDGVHFSDRTLPPLALGWRAAAVNLSDLAAMGAAPLGITLGLTLPPATPWLWLEQVYQGLTACLERYGGAIIGGDLCRGPHRSLAVTAMGSVLQNQVFYRHQGQAGQVLVTTGVHGASRAGLALLLDELEPLGPTATVGQSWIAAHQRPRPRFDAIATLRTLESPGCDAIYDAIAVMDTSDGLADAVIQICQQSHVGAILRRSQLPIPPGLVDVVGPAMAENWTLYGGEDFELVLSLPAAIAAAFVERLPGSQIIGQTTLAPEVRLVDDIAQHSDVYLQQNLGYQHF